MPSSQEIIGDFTSSSSEATTRKALVIAVSDYSSSLQTLDFCKKDGEETYQLLKSLGYEVTVHHKLIGHVTYESMREAILDFFTDISNKAEDTLLFYYSGHGIPDIDGDIYLASSEIDPDAPYRRGFSFNELTKMIQRSVSIRIVTVLDCCYSGAAKLSKGHEEDAAKLGTVAIDNKANVLQQGEGKCLLAASQAAQEAYALKEGEHSIFTYYLLEGLKGNERSVDAYGNIKPTSLGNFIYRSMLNLPAKKRPKQKPITKVEASGDIILASYPDLIRPKPVDNARASSSVVSNPVTETPTLPKPESEKEKREEDKRSSSPPPPYPLTSSKKEKEEQSGNNDYLPTTTKQREEEQKRGFGISPKILIPIIAAVAVIGGLIAFTYLGQMNQTPDSPPTGTEDGNQPAQQEPASVPEAQSPESQTTPTINNAEPPIVSSNNRPPVARDSPLITTSMNQPVAIQFSGGDDDNNSLTAATVSKPSRGTLGPINQTTGVVTYTPNPGFVGTDEFTFRVNDGIVNSTNIGTVRIQVNNPPVPIDKSLTTTMNTPIDIKLEANDHQNDSLTAQTVSQPANGELGPINQTTGVVTYTPNPGFVGTDSFTFKVNDGKVDSSNVGTVRIQVS